MKSICSQDSKVLPTVQIGTAMGVEVGWGRRKETGLRLETDAVVFIKGKKLRCPIALQKRPDFSCSVRHTAHDRFPDMGGGAGGPIEVQVRYICAFLCGIRGARYF